MNLRISIKDSATPRLASLIATLSGPGRSDLNRAAGAQLQVVTASHVAVLAATRHTTAERLGATPTNFFASAAEKVAQASALTADSSGATLTINHPGFIRAFRSVKIVPRTARSLAIPIHAISYGHRAAALWDRLALFIPKGKRVICAKLGGVITPLYILCKSVTMKQDRSLLPSDEEFQEAAIAGAKSYLGGALSAGGKI
ncbi:MAG: hypothetical protein ABI615_01775 [Chthoniobacterales bacterium]